jgi:uncharacterized cupredoxin-like copper-binding protein
MFNRRKIIAGLAAVAALSPMAAVAKGNLATRPTEIKLKLNGDLSMSAKEFKIETGKYYRLVVESQGGDEFRFMAPDLWNNSWVNQIAINGIEIHTAKTLEIEFDKDGAVEILFVPIRTGKFKFWIRGQEARGMAGEFVVE